MKILITTDWYKPAINGVVTSVTNLADGLERLGHEVRVLTLADGIQSFCDGNVSYLGSINANRIYPSARVRTVPASKITGGLIAWRPDIVHSQCEFSTFPLARKIARACAAPLIHTYHTVYEDYTNYFSLYIRLGRNLAKLFTKRIISETDAVIAPTDKISRLLERYEVDKPVYVIPSGLALERFAMSETEKAARRAVVRGAYGIGENEPLFLYVGRLAKEKNITALLDSLKSSACESCKLLIAGDGPYRGELEAYAEKLGTGRRVIFAGMVSPDRVVDYYAAGDIFVSASHSETQGLTYIEAMASSLPVLCEYDPCLDGIIEGGVNGFTYRSREQFGEYSDLLFSSEQYRRKLGEAAAKTVCEKFSSERFADSACEVYSESIENYVKRDNKRAFLIAT